MKTAEDWMKDLLVLMGIEEGADIKSECPEQWNKLSQFLQQIQLDAFKAGKIADSKIHESAAYIRTGNDTRDREEEGL